MVVGLALCEAALRLLPPRYGHLAAPPRQALGPAEVLHPDTAEPHSVVYNNLGSRQHRHFAERDLAEAVNLAFFGDSFTENLRMAAHYSFTEILDYLLNARPDGTFDKSAKSTGARFNVLNFGIDGTGTGAQYAHYRALPFKRRFDHVFYVYHQSDVRDLRRAAGWALNDADQLVAQLIETPLWRRILGRLHLTYLVLDVWGRSLLREVGETGAGAVMSVDETLPVFDALLRRWREEVRASGGMFHIVLLPTPAGRRWMEGKIASAGWRVLDLGNCFNNLPTKPPTKLAELFFQRDFHWNEAGNMLAAHCLYRYLAGTFEQPGYGDEDLARMRHAYYAAFLRESAAWQGHRFMPGAPWALPSPAPNEDAAHRIVAHYQALGDDAAERRDRIVRAARATRPVLRSLWNVHLDRKHRLVVFVRAPCDEDDPAAGIFLRWRPWNLADLIPADRTERYKTRKKALTPVRRRGGGNECLLLASLPAAPLASVHTGQYTPSGEVLWQGEFAVDDADAFAAVDQAHRREYEAVAATTPAARSVWNLHRKPAERELAYLKSPCDIHDTLGEFFLRVRPMEPLAGVSGGHLEIPILFLNSRPRDPGARLWRNPAVARPGSQRRATMFENKCMMTIPLPDWPIGDVWTGVYGPDKETVQWEERFYFDIDALRRIWRRALEREPNASGAFDVYRQGRTLTYVREPCGQADVRDRFFLHVFGTASDFANLDFDFHERGALFDGTCVAVAWLPDYAQRIATGQFAPPAERVWQVEL